MKNLKGRVAVITGAGGGLGRALSLELASRGCHLALVDVSCLFAAANRDERAFEEPDRIIPERSSNPHLSFGFGIHFCAGAQLARLEARIASSAVLERVPDFEMKDDRVERFPSLMLGEVERLPVTFTPGNRRNR